MKLKKMEMKQFRIDLVPNPVVDPIPIQRCATAKVLHKLLQVVLLCVFLH